MYEFKQELSKEVSVVKDEVEFRTEKVLEELGTVADVLCAKNPDSSWAEVAKRRRLTYL